MKLPTTQIESIHAELNSEDVETDERMVMVWTQVIYIPTGAPQDCVLNCVIMIAKWLAASCIFCQGCSLHEAVHEALNTSWLELKLIFASFSLAA